MGKIGIIILLLEKLASIAVVIMPHAVSLKRLYQIIKVLKKGESIKKDAIKTAVLAVLESCGVLCPPIQVAA